MRLVRAFVLLIVAACAAEPHAVRFAGTPVVVAVDDRRDVPHAPAPRPFYRHLYHYDGAVKRPLERTLELTAPRRALGVNALDEVPDSTWFTNRIGVRDLSLDELRAGPAVIDSPDLHKPWTIMSTKAGGAEIGFMMRDARGVQFVLKFDTAGLPEQETAAHVIVNHLLWAIGYHVPEDFLVRFRPDELALAPGATIKGPHPRSLDRRELERRLASLDRAPDGSVRAIASRWLPGTWLGGPPGEGVRPDDPNDRIPHERRRDLRGLYAIAAWLDHVDIKEDNFVDMWIPDPQDPRRHYVEHYLVDFGGSLGVMASIDDDPRHGFEYFFDPAAAMRSLATVGLATRAWERRDMPAIRGVGMFDAGSFDPGAWKNHTPAFVPFHDADRFDNFWAAKLVMRFSRAQLHAIVESGGYGDPRAVEYLTDTLVARQRATGAYWFARVNPLDEFVMDGGALCFDDLAIMHGFVQAAGTRYEVTLRDRGGSARGRARIVATAGDRTCVPIDARSADRYAVATITTLRSTFHGATDVHVISDAAPGDARVVGVWRE